MDLENIRPLLKIGQVRGLRKYLTFPAKQYKSEIMDLEYFMIVINNLK